VLTCDLERLFGSAADMVPTSFARDDVAGQDQVGVPWSGGEQVAAGEGQAHAARAVRATEAAQNTSMSAASASAAPAFTR
jgi:hypothetical protein